MRYSFGDFEFQEVTLELYKNDERVHIEPQVAALLELLIDNRDRIVSKQDISSHIWVDRIASDASIDNRISAARAALGDSGRQQCFIKTFSGRGFRFVAPVETVDQPAVKADDADLETSEGPNSVSGNRRTLLGVAATLFIGLFAILGSQAFSTHPDAPGIAVTQVDPFRASVAILPFTNLSSDGEEDYLGTGLASELTSVLARIDGLQVTSSSSAFRLASASEQNVAEPAKILGVSHIIEGSFAREGSTLKVMVHLIDTAQDDRVWTETYSRPYDASNIIRIQEEIVSSVVVEMLGELMTPPQLPTIKTDSIEALDLYYRAQAALRLQTPDSIRQAIEFLKRAIAVDPTYVDPHSLLVRAYDDAFFVAGLSWEEMRREKQVHLARALELAPDDPQVLLAEGIVKHDDGAPKAAIPLFQRVLAADPNNAYALSSIAVAYFNLGRMSEAREFHSKARKVDPLNPAVLQGLTLTENLLGNTAVALEVARTNVRWNASNPAAQDALAWLLMQFGDYSEAHRHYLSVVGSESVHYDVLLDVADLYLRVGWDERAEMAVTPSPIAEAILGSMLSNRGEVESFLAGSPDFDPTGHETGLMYFYLLDFETALPFMKRAIDEREVIGPTEMGVRGAAWFVPHAHVLRAAGDSDGDMLLKKIEEPLSDITPQTADSYYAFIAGAGVQMLRGDEEKAIEWLEAAVEEGHVFIHLMRHPTFAPLEDNTRYQMLQAEMETKARQYRSVFADQLALAENWVASDPSPKSGAEDQGVSAFTPDQLIKPI